MVSSRHPSGPWLTLLIALALLIPPFARAADPVTYYVAPDGDDAAPGTLEKPFRTPRRAADATRGDKSRNAAVTVYLRGGTYFLDKPFALGADDSGAEGSPVIYSAYKDEKPILSAGRPVTGWQKKQLDGKDVWAAKLALPENIGPLRSLWVNGRRAMRARQPDAGYFAVDAVPEATGEWSKGVASFKFSGNDLRAWQGVADGAEIIVMSRWVESRLPVKEIDEATKTARFGKNSVFVIEKGDKYWVEGAAPFLDAPGEWHYDRASSMLYYLPRSGEDMSKAEAVFPALSHVLILEGDRAQGKSITHVTFRGLTFSHADWGQGWPGWPEDRSGFSQAAIGVPAAVRAEGISQCTFDRCTIAHVGTYAMELGRGCRNNRVAYCTFTDLGAGGVKIGETTVRESEKDHVFANEVSDCRISDGGNQFPSAVGLWIGQSFDNRITHNEIANFYYTGISVGWTWGYGTSLARGNVIEHNHVHHIGKPADDPEAPILSDMAGIYTLGVQPGTVIRYNRFHDVAGIKYGGWGIYYDEGSTNIVAEKNVVYRTTHGGFHQHYGKDNVFRNNVIAFGRDFQVQRTRSEPHQSFSFERNIVYWTAGDPLTGNWDNRNVEFNRNVYWRTDGKRDFRFANMSLEEWRQKGMDVHSAIADPGFVNPAADDFTLRSNSPALGVGFVAFDQSDVGPRQR